MTVRSVTSNDFESIALIHKASYSDKHLTSFFPLKLLEEYYKAVWVGNNFAFIAESEEGEPLGFVIGGDKLHDVIQQFIRTHKWDLAKVVLKHPEFIVQRIADRLKRTFQHKETDIPFQLLSIAVKNGKQSAGCGKLLLEIVEQQLREAGITQYGLSVKKINNRAINFYEKNNFKVELETVTIRCYYKDLTPNK